MVIVAQKNVPMFAWFGKITLVWSTDIIQDPENFMDKNATSWLSNEPYITWLESNWFSNEPNKMVNHWNIFLSIYNFDWLFTSVISSITKIVPGNNKKGHVILFVLLCHVELGYSTFLPLPPPWKPFLLHVKLQCNLEDDRWSLSRVEIQTRRI